MLETSRGAAWMNPTRFVADGVIQPLGAPDLDGKGVVSDRFIPKRGVVGVGKNPKEPITTPRNSTRVLPKFGLALALIEGLTAASAVSVIEMQKAVELQEGYAKAQAEEDTGIAAAIMAAAQECLAPVASAIRAKVMTKKKTEDGSKGPPRYRIVAYSRNKP